jgi:hypothetical protein
MSNFYTDVISNDPRFNSPTRISDLALLEPVMRQAVQNIIAGASASGLTMEPFETYRSQARQAALYAQRATKLRTVGVHHYGLACDIVFVVDGQPSWKGDFSALRDLARANSLVWGGDWGEPSQPHTFIDMDHVQRCTLAQQPELFAGTWYPEGLAPAGTIGT